MNKERHYVECQIFLIADGGFLYYFVSNTLGKNSKLSWNWDCRVDGGKALTSLIKSASTLTAAVADCRR